MVSPNAESPLSVNLPIVVSDMRFGVRSEAAKIASAKGADQAGTGVCFGEGGMLPEEQEINSRYVYEDATGKVGWDIGLVERVQAFHYKAGQAATTGTGGYLPGETVKARSAVVRGLKPGGQTQ